MLLRTLSLALLLISPAYGRGTRGFLTSNLPKVPSVSDEEIDAFRRGHKLKSGAQVKIQEHKKDGTFRFRSASYSLDECEPNALLENAVIKAAELVNPGLSCTIRGNNKAQAIIVQHDGEGAIQEALFIDTNAGKSMTLLPIKEGSLAEYDNADLDPEEFKNVLLEPPGWNGGNGGKRNLKEEDSIGDMDGSKNTSYSFKNDFSHRRLDLSSCGTVRAIVVSFGIDAYFRTYYGGDAGALARLESIVAAASVYYEQFCKTIEIGVVDVNKLVDYSSIVNRPYICFDELGNDILEKFREAWSNAPDTPNPGTATGQAHLFFGSGGVYSCAGDCIVGCAFQAATCLDIKNSPYPAGGYGVNYMTYEVDRGLGAPSLYTQGVLFAHEMGHTAGSGHDADNSGFVMQPTIGSGITGFSSNSINEINAHIDQISNPACVTCTPDPLICNTPSGACGASVSGLDTCNGVCTKELVMCPSDEETCQAGECVSCDETQCTPDQGQCGDGMNECDNSCIATCSGLQVCNDNNLCGDPPTAAPTNQPSLSGMPSFEPSLSGMPSSEPSEDPSAAPSHEPSSAPSQEPTTMTSTSPSAIPSDLPSLSPSEMPSVTPAWYDITFDTFENGWGNFQDFNGAADKKDAARVTSQAQQNWIPRGSASLRIRDNQGIDSSVWHKDDHDVTEYTNLQVSFFFSARSMEMGKDFFLEYSSAGGADDSWTTVKEYIRGGQASTNQQFYFSNDQIYQDTVDFNAIGMSYARTDQARIRFRCDADNNDDMIYIDNVRFQGYK